jgi:pto-interacting protein 1
LAWFLVLNFLFCLSIRGISGYPKGSKVSAPAKAEVQKEAPPVEVPVLSLEELKEKTDNFGSKALIGEGSYGRVYYANLENGKAVAIKKLDVASEPETNVEFLTQVCFHFNGKRMTCI